MSIEMLKGKTLVEIRGAERGSGEIIFVANTGEKFRMHHYQDCCENVLVEDICGYVEDLLNSPILVAESRTSNVKSSRYESGTWTFYELATNLGSVTLRWLGTSNGYYSESVSFDRMEFHDQAKVDGELAEGVYEVKTIAGNTEWWYWSGSVWKSFGVLELSPYEARYEFEVLGEALRRQ